MGQRKSLEQGSGSNANDFTDGVVIFILVEENTVVDAMWHVERIMPTKTVEVRQLVKATLCYRRIMSC